MNDAASRVTRVADQSVSDSELLADVKRVAGLFGEEKLSLFQYIKHGAYRAATIHQRFGSWNKAIVAAGLSCEFDSFDDSLFENLLLLWQHYGRQPRRTELSLPPSVISLKQYNRRFGGWAASLYAFVSYANSMDLDPRKLQTPASIQNSRSTGRDPSLRLRWKVLQHDRFTCRRCGRSPATGIGIELLVDRIIAWSEGGETTFGNLQTLCSDCKLGKSRKENAA